jgi:DNA primase
MEFNGGGYKELTEENILKEVSEFDMFIYYIPDFEAINKKFCSPLRGESSPSCSIKDMDGKLFYKDFGDGKAYTAINFVRARYGVSYYEALRMISNDFNIGLNNDDISPKSMGVVGVTGLKKESVPKETTIKIKRREWNQGLDKEYWSEYGWNRDVADHFNVHPISHLWINGTYLIIKDDNPSYAYCIKNKFKILSPFSDFKWISNTTVDDIQGWEQLPESGDMVIITSSLKDVGTLYKYGYSACAPSAESSGVSVKIITELQRRFKQVIIFFDNDGEFDPEDLANGKGKASAKKLSMEHVLKMVFIPDGEPKDISDHYKKYGNTKTKELLNKIL